MRSGGHTMCFSGYTALVSPSFPPAGSDHALISLPLRTTGMAFTVELPDELRDRLDAHLEEDETYAELVEELLNIYESSRFVREGYSE